MLVLKVKNILVAERKEIKSNCSGRKQGEEKKLRKRILLVRLASAPGALLQCPLTDSLNVPGLLENDRKSSLSRSSSPFILSHIFRA